MHSDRSHIDGALRHGAHGGPPMLQYRVRPLGGAPTRGAGVTLRRRLVGGYSLIQLSTRVPLQFDRTMAQVCEDDVDVTSLSFLRQGRLQMTSPAGGCAADFGDLVVANSRAPVHVSYLTGQSGVHEALHIVLPTAAFAGLLSQPLRTGYRVRAYSHAFAIAERLLVDLLDDTGELSDDLPRTLADSALKALCCALTASRGSA